MLADGERGWPLRGFVLGDLHIIDRGRCGSDPEPVDEGVDLTRFAAGEYLDPAVGEIAGVPGDSELAGPSLRAATVEDALHSPGHPADPAYQRGVLPSTAFTGDSRLQYRAEMFTGKRLAAPEAHDPSVIEFAKASAASCNFSKPTSDQAHRDQPMAFREAVARILWLDFAKQQSTDWPVKSP